MTAVYGLFVRMCLVGHFLFGPVGRVLRGHGTGTSTRVRSTIGTGRRTRTVGTRCRGGVRRTGGETGSVIVATRGATTVRDRRVLGRTSDRMATVGRGTRGSVTRRGHGTIGRVGKRVNNVTIRVTKGIVRHRVDRRSRTGLVSRFVRGMNRTS